MRVHDSSIHTSSPRSSDGAASCHDSPDTKLTAFSPEDVRSMGLTDKHIIGLLNEDEICSFPPISASDPFLVPTGRPGHVQLSPTASTFTPIGVNGNLIGVPLNRSVVSTSSGMSYLAADSEPETQGLRNGSTKYVDQSTSAFGPIGMSSMIKESISPHPTNYSQVDYDKRSRAFVIEEVPTGFTYLNLAGFFSRREFGTLKGPNLSELKSNGRIYVSFTDSREARHAMDKVHLLRPEWRVVPLTAIEYARRSGTSTDQISDFEGQIYVTVYYNPSLDEHTVGSSIKSLAETFGDVKAFRALCTGQRNVIEFQIEFFDTRDAENAVTVLNGTSLEDCVLEVRLYRPDLEPSESSSPSRETRGRLFPSGSFGRTSLYLELSPTGRSMLPRGEHAGLPNWPCRSEERMGFPQRHEQNRFPDPRSNSQNFVDIERIRCGLDVRTTIMLRNIPNKIDQAMLKEIVDETSHGKYDFMYLRIDFANNCNVGYAFINFEDPIDIIDFVKARAGRTWNCFNSDKVAEISYATIQGKDCLVQKFRNSSVMLEHPSFRPKIFHTGNGPLSGTEDRFPGPDNPSKMRRSVENAEHVGLFAPRVGQQYRDEQRRRRSQYDRGTTAAEREIVCVRTCAPRRPSIVNGLRTVPCTLPAMKACDVIFPQ
ncbi:hypothetical protein Egran_05756 [Elaphomyces granulatus]|uniref:RRM domain-containing protein n=1 Tax=Elaphomyces granulatus TaxID=519963 RepID=A0A232LQP2_9EURO|nr:hypothetical protein Egran_05756 [Elaphomyces granulatus]